jgi:hypothetical protein
MKLKGLQLHEISRLTERVELIDKITPNSILEVFLSNS